MKLVTVMSAQEEMIRVVQLGQVGKTHGLDPVVLELKPIPPEKRDGDGVEGEESGERIFAALKFFA